MLILNKDQHSSFITYGIFSKLDRLYFDQFHHALALQSGHQRCLIYIAKPFWYLQAFLFDDQLL